MINLTINGQAQCCDADTIDGLLQNLNLAQSQVAVELNGSIVPRDAFSETLLQNGDQLEIVRFVGGG
ncbi:MAG: sulfur carrier protein ThiS [Desulfuromonadaceae bacterium]|nr:sulfur carrier protein ThiS [Desulfuromonadaceae bacterium]